jgi:hypothetical protein
MARGPRLAALRRVLLTRQVGWWLAYAFAVLGILIAARRLARAADLAGQALEAAIRLVLDAGWLLLLVTAFGLAAGLTLSSPRGRATTHRLRRRLRTRPVLVGAAATGLLAVLVLVVFVLPPLLGGDDGTVQNNVRTTLLQGFAALLVLTGAATGAAVTLRQVRTTREGQITDRYTRAVDQLGSQHLDVRLGGIYALERIARDSPPDRATIEEVLTAYVRGHAPWPPPAAPTSPPTITQRLVTFAQWQRSALRRWTAKDTAGQTEDGPLDRPPGHPLGSPPGDPPKPAPWAVPQGPPAYPLPSPFAVPQGPPADVQAAVTVLGRRQRPPEGLRQLDLSRVDLRGANLIGADLEGAQLSGANLQGAQLGGANLGGARLNHTNLGGTELGGANLWCATLIGANLGGAQLHGANLQGAVIGMANLQGAWAWEDTRWPIGWDRADAEALGVTYIERVLVASDPWAQSPRRPSQDPMFLLNAAQAAAKWSRTRLSETPPREQR